MKASTYRKDELSLNCSKLEDVSLCQSKAPFPGQSSMTCSKRTNVLNDKKVPQKQNIKIIRGHLPLVIYRMYVH